MQGHAGGVDVAVPIAKREAEALVLIFGEAALQGGVQFRPGVRVAGLDGVEQVAALVFFHGSQIGPAGGGGGQRQALTHVHAQGGGFRRAAVLDVDHRQAVAAGQANRGIGVARKFIQVGFGQLAHPQVGNIGVTQRQYARVELVFFQLSGVAQVAQLGQRVGHARDRWLGQAGDASDILVAHDH